MFQTTNSWDALEKSIHDAGWSDTSSSANTAPTISVRAANAQAKSLTPTEQYELSIAVHSAVCAITNNLTVARFRAFSATGMEIVGGPLYDLLQMPAPGLSQSRLIEEIVSWYAITGELAVNIVPRDGVPVELLPLAPTMLRVTLPTKPPKTRQDVVQWGYRWADGTEELIRDDHLVFERMFNPNARSIRGLSPLVTGAVQVSGSYYAERYNKQFFENNAIPSHVINVGEGVPRVQREAFTRQYLQSYSNYSNNAHKVAVVAGGKDFDVTVLEQPFQDGAFMEMMKRGDLKVGQLYRVPAINMGIYDKSRFDTANEERKLFLEETLEPMARRVAEAFQLQLVDPFFQYTKHQYGRVKKSKSLQKQIARAKSDRPSRGGIILILDTDELPIKHEVQLAKTEHALKLREAYDISARRAEEWVGLEFDDERPERDEIFVPNNRVCITNPKLNESLIPGIKGGEDEEKKPAEKAVADPALVKIAEKFLRKVRRLTFDALDNGTMWSLTEGDTLAGDERLKPLVRFVRHGARQLQDKDALKQFLNDLDPAQHLQ
jgi:HK97 family phage portal protein